MNVSTVCIEHPECSSKVAKSKIRRDSVYGHHSLYACTVVLTE